MQFNVRRGCAWRASGSWRERREAWVTMLGWPPKRHVARKKAKPRKPSVVSSSSRAVTTCFGEWRSGGRPLHGIDGIGLAQKGGIAHLPELLGSGFSNIVCALLKSNGEDDDDGDEENSPLCLDGGFAVRLLVMTFRSLTTPITAPCFSMCCQSSRH